MWTVHLLIRGKVHGVFYRATAQEIAELYGVKGWVKNTAGGEVEVMATGETGDIESFIQWCRQGPPKATVTHVEIDEKPVEAFTSFKVIR